jgi:hypothetical protein
MPKHAFASAVLVLLLPPSSSMDHIASALLADAALKQIRELLQRE